MHFQIIFCVMMLAFVFFRIQISLLKRLNAKHAVYDLAPDSHQAKEAVSMGGLVFLLLSLGCLFTLFLPFVNGFSSPEIIWLNCLCVAFALIGLCDDVASLLKNKNQGLNTLQKLSLQIGVSIILMGAYALWVAPIGFVFFLLAVFVIVATSNATNLTDGVDALLGTLSVISLIAFLLFFFLGKPLDAAKGAIVLSELNVFISLVIALLTIFLVYNKYPAKIFMGDTGSLYLGALFAGLAILYGNVFILIPVGMPYILETLSVIVQVAYYKRTKQRVFLMAPLHHHFEILGFSERQLVLLFNALYCLVLGVYVVFKGFFF